MLKTAIYLMRHGRTSLDPMHRSDGWLDLPLSEKGQQNTVEAIQRIKHINFKEVHAAPLKRTKETAEIAQSAIVPKPKLEISKGPITWNLGKLAGTPKKPNKPIVAQYLKNRDLHPPGGETNNEFGDRFWPWLKNLLSKGRAGKGPILAVLSGSNFRYISEKLFHDPSILDVDENGIVVLYPTGKTSFGAQVICGHKTVDQEDYS